MIKGTSSLVIHTLLSFLLIATKVDAAESPHKKSEDRVAVNRSQQYSIPDEQIHSTPPLGKAVSTSALKSVFPTQSPGATIGVTWWDAQQVGSMGRMIDWGLHGVPDTMLVHFGWMYQPGPDIFAREYRYRSYNAAAGVFGAEVGLQSVDDFAGYVGLDVTEDGRAVIGGHNRESSVDEYTDCHFYWDSAPGASSFSVEAQVPRAVAEFGGPPNQQVYWPKFRYQEGFNDTVLHVFARVSGPITDDPKALYYFRKVGTDASGIWDNPPFVVDTVYNIAHDVAANSNSKVALIWIANLPCPGDQCDTCSGYECWQFPQWDNDLYYQTSLDGSLTWQPRVNITMNIDGEEGYRPYTDLSALITSDGNLHIVWGARYWPADANDGGEAGSLRGRIFHWSEDNPYVRTVHNFEWDQTTCNGGAWQLNVSKMTVSECDGKLYVLFVQFNDLPKGVEDDCAAMTNPGFPSGAANGELYLTISSDGGLTWDEARNLTNSRTPGCDSLGGSGGLCDSDHWPSMSRFGSDYSGDFTATDIVVPDGSSDPGTYYLDIQYLNDRSAGSIVQNEGFWEEASMRWFRIPCVDPIPNPRLILSLSEINYPAWAKHGSQFDTTLVIQNPGNVTLNYSITVEEDTGPNGWLSTGGFSGSVLFGLDSTETGTVSLNTGGIVNNPGTIVALVGRLIFSSNAPTSPDTLTISCWVADTIYPPLWDTIYTDCIALTVSNTGNFGNLGIGRVNMDYADAGDCDTTAEVYLYDGSPIIGWVQEADTIVHYSMYGTTVLSKNGFRPVSEHLPAADSGDYKIYRSGTLVTNDLNLAVEETWYGPKQPDSCNFIIQRFRVYPYVGQQHNDLIIGAAVDWDIPSDSGSDNGSNFDADRNLIYQFGGEYNQDDSTECQENDVRFGGIMFLDGFLVNDTTALGDSIISNLYGAYTRDNATYVFPHQSFLPQELYANMRDSGYSVYSSAHPDSQLVDLHTVMTFSAEVDLGATDTLLYYTSLVSVMNGALVDLQEIADRSYQWYSDHLRPVPNGCCIPPLRGNVDFDGGDNVNVADLTYLIDFLFRGGATPLCWAEGNVNGDVGEQINVADLTFLVDYLFRGGSVPPPCP